MKDIFRLGCIAAALLAAGLFFASPGGKAADSPEDVLLMQQEAWNRGDLAAFMDGYWRSPELTFFYAGTVRKGWDEVFARYRRRYQGEGAEMGRLAFSELRVTMMGRRHAMARGRWRLEFPSGKPPAGGLFTVVMEKMPGGWRIVHDHTSSDEEK